MKIKDVSANIGGVTDEGELFGIEIEVENVRVPEDLGPYWRVVEDGSLRNAGMEFVSVPCGYDDALTAIGQFYTWNSVYRYESNVRTSTHVHYNVLGYDTSELAAALTAYSIVEPLLFRICGHEREENIYCVPWYRGPDQAMYVQQLARDRLRGFDMSCKYSALYLEPVNRFGTVEFRHAPVFLGRRDLVFWLDIIRALMTNGRELKTGAEVIRSFDSLGAERFVVSILGTALSDRLRDKCGGASFESILDDADSISVAEACVPLLDTYKARDWLACTTVASGNNQEGYHRVAFSPDAMMYAPDEEQYESDYYNEHEPSEEQY